jgi:hypothetical protein
VQQQRPPLDTNALAIGAGCHVLVQPVVFTLKMPFHLDHRKQSQPNLRRWEGIFVSATPGSAERALNYIIRSIVRVFIGRGVEPNATRYFHKPT